MTLSLHLGPLTRIAIVLVSANPLIELRPFARVYAVRLFRVYWGSQGFTPGHRPCSALQDAPARRTRSCEILKLERAIGILDWLFTPRPESEERVARHYPFGPPRTFRPASSCSGLDRMISRSRPVARRGGTTRSLTGCVAYRRRGNGSRIKHCRAAFRLRTIGFPEPRRLGAA